MEKTELLEKIEKKELARLDSLSYEQLSKEANEWFNDIVLPSESRIDIINDLMTDFMRYRNDEGVEELTEKLNGYKAIQEPIPF